MISDSLTVWNGIPIKLYTLDEELQCPDTIYKIAYSWDEEVEFSIQFAKYLEDPKCADSIGLSIGLNEESANEFYDEAVKLFLQNAGKFPKLKWLFLGDMEGEESELTWIEQGDVGAPVLDLFPHLEVFYARGGEGSMKFSKCAHKSLKKLVLQPAGIDDKMFKNILASDFPELEELELWLGSEERGADLNEDDVRDLLLGNPFPKLKSLGLMNSEITNSIAKDIATAPILDQLETLDLSMGTLQDDGALALLASDKVKTLKKLNLSHHYVSEDVAKQFSDLGIQVDLSDPEEADEWDGIDHYYVAISE